ncbi:HAD family hydrolase [Lacticaseibacillus kribbianus]|uniref:HAD family hydrolase n=1 Tax=Lacticaseibacillus kribbianus TaxID=2926292 RepID=UPI001CD34E5A|nr:HAD family hydrolase [Lacticaseibacillus kribbianus]
MTDIRLIASDMDQTLLKSDKQLPAGTFDRIRALAAAGIEFVADSGRAVYTLEAMFAPVLDAMTLVAENGAVIKRHGELLATNLMRPADYHEVVRATQARQLGVPLICTLDSTLFAEADRGVQQEMSHFIATMGFIPDLLALTEDVPKATVYFAAGDAYTQADAFYRPHFGDRLAVTVGGPTFIDLMAPNVNKGRALRQLGAKLGIAPAAMMAFGDTDNDIEMMQTVGYGVRMANATPNMAAHTNYRTASNDEAGVLRGIDLVLAGQLPAQG